MAVTELNEENFESSVSKGTCVVDFFASWCGPCKMMAPVIESTAMSLPDVAFYKVDVDNAQKLAMNYKVVSVPTLVVFKDGQPVKKSVGVIFKAELIDLIK